MTASYVLVTAAAVIVVEAIVIGVILPNYLAGQDLTSRVLYTAGNEAERVGDSSLSSTTVTLPADFTLATTSSPVDPGTVVDDGQGVAVPNTDTAVSAKSGPVTAAVLISTTGTILASTDPAQFPIGGSANSLLPAGPKSLEVGRKGTISSSSSGQVAWAVQPVMIQLAKNRGVARSDAPKPNAPDAYVYVQAPVQPFVLVPPGDAAPFLNAGLVVLLLALPVGTLFGLLATRTIVRRLRRLAGTTAMVAEGDFSQRVAAGSADEVGKLERNFNEMAERLATAVSRERMLADKSAREAERNRISRELHDSISQDLFSISLIAAGLERALPENSPLRAQVHTLVETTEATNREMRALLLELRPAMLEERGLLPALEELASAYSVRLGVKIDAELEPVRMQPAAELAALRIAQEGIANAVKHARATNIKLELHRTDGHADITVSDDGGGFDPGANGAAEGLGLRLMRERVEELGGSLKISSRPGEGSIVVASIPGVID